MPEIERRRFLQLSAACAAPLALGIRFASAETGARDSDEPVVIVGAGMAGLRAAGILRRAGRRVVLLEARSRPGGRVETIRAPFDVGLSAEAGPIRIASSHKRVLGLVRSFGLHVVPFDSMDGSALLEIGGLRIPSDIFEKTNVPLKLKPEEKLLPGALLQYYVGTLPSDLASKEPTAASYARWTAIDQVTWPNWLRGRGASDGAIRLMTLGGDSSELSALYVLRQIALLQGATFYKIHEGMDQLPRAMMSSMRDIIRFNASVVRMDQTSKPVRVDYLEEGQRMNTVRASHVIVTTPLTTLRQIEVRPPFSARKERAIDQVPYFPATRFLLQSRSRFWHTEGLSGSARTDQPAEIWDCTYDLKSTLGILGATVGGALGTKVLDLSAEKSVAFGAELVANAFPAIRSEFQKGYARRWALEPWSQGAFAVYHPGQMSTMMPELARPEGRVHFAGEHTSSWMGWMEGALSSGERAAGEVLRSQLN